VGRDRRVQVRDRVVEVQHRLFEGKGARFKTCLRGWKQQPRYRIPNPAPNGNLEGPKANACEKEQTVRTASWAASAPPCPRVFALCMGADLLASLSP
jgi:hypothetical protein